jgi:5'-nucleotidase
MRMTRSTPRRLAASTLGIGLAVAGLTAAGAAPASAAAPVDIQILATNDFHGRILQNASGGEAGAAVLAGAVEQLRGANPNTVFAAAGDLIGASTFESFIQDDKPTIDALNAAGLEVSAVGNHELDQGYDDLVNRVMAPYDATTNPEGGAEWQYIAANLKMKATGDPAVPATFMKSVGGVDVGFVGAVTEDLPSLVSPAGIADIDVTDIVDSVNAEAADLRADGADVVVMLVHEGSASTDCSSAQFTDPSTTWGNIVQNVSSDVDAIVSGHTHLAYNCDVADRPVVSAGRYGVNLNQLDFSVDPDTGDVLGVTHQILPLMSPDPDGSGPGLPTALYPADPAVQTIVQDAKDKAAELGARVLGQVGAPFNRAKLADGTTENRGGESTLGNLVAEVQRWATRNPESGAAQIAFMNPGGLRDDMAGTVNGDARDVTYKQAAVVQPFANTLVNMDLTGAQIETVLEQQWQRDAGGKVPSRPFLRLGVSKGFTYTYTETPVTAPGQQDGTTVDTFQGEVTGMWLHGKPIDPDATYSVTVNSFLASGGDNFREFANGAHQADTGKVDLSAMVDYMAQLASDSPLPVDYRQRAVETSDVAPAEPGGDVSFDVASWSMSTDADVKDSEITVKLGGKVLGTAAVDNTVGTTPYDNTGTAHVDVTLPADAKAGATSLTLVGADTGTKVHVPLKIKKAVPTLKVTVTPDRVVAGETKALVTVKVVAPNGIEPTGDASVEWSGRHQAGGVGGSLVNGKFKARLPVFKKPGTKTLTIEYGGNGQLAKVTDRVTITVKR